MYISCNIPYHEFLIPLFVLKNAAITFHPQVINGSSQSHPVQLGFTVSTFNFFDCPVVFFIPFLSFSLYSLPW